MERDFNSHQRIAVLLDSSNLYHIARRRKVKINHAKLLERLNGRQIVRSILYRAGDNSDREKPFLKKMKGLGFEVKSKDLKTYGKKKKGNVDVDMAIEAVSLSEKVDVIVLGSGDGDFVPVVKYLQAKGVKVELIAFKGCGTSVALREAVDSFIPITEDMLFRRAPEDSTK
jgi:uncharacterized LabA/DUF88 family protein